MLAYYLNVPPYLIILMSNITGTIHLGKFSGCCSKICHGYKKGMYRGGPRLKEEPGQIQYNTQGWVEDFTQVLPQELWGVIMDNVTRDELAALSAVNKEFHRLSSKAWTKFGVTR